MNRKHRTPALLLCLCTLLTAGCSRGGGEAAQEENVSYSQTLYPGMEMSAEQKNAVRAVEGVGESCILYRREDDRIFCFYTGAIDEKTLKAALKEKLARYMVPDVTVRLGEMPHTASMKIDRATLTKRMMEEAKPSAN